MALSSFAASIDNRLRRWSNLRRFPLSVIAGLATSFLVSCGTASAAVTELPALVDEIGLATLAQLQQRVNLPTAPLPEPWRIARIHRDWTGLDIFVFRNDTTDATVIAIKGVETGDLRDMVSLWMRRKYQAYSPHALRHAERWQDYWNPDRFLIIGHSGGGGLASWLGSELSVPTVTFNSGRTDASLLNDGEQQVNVIIRGDEFGDPILGLYGQPLPGTNIYLEALDEEPTHWMETIIAGLARERF